MSNLGEKQTAANTQSASVQVKAVSSNVRVICDPEECYLASGESMELPAVNLKIYTGNNDVEKKVPLAGFGRIHTETAKVSFS